MHWFVLALEIIGTVAFAVSGATTAIRKNMDIFGVCVMSVTTATGGGVLRDILLGAAPPAAFINPRYVLIAVFTAILTFLLFGKKLTDDNNRLYEIVLLISDSLGLGIFTVRGADVAIGKGFSQNLFLVICVAVITGVGGGVLRDIFAGDRPYIFVKHIYAVASLLGAILYILLRGTLSENLNIAICVLFILAVRICSAYFHWSLPKIKLDE